MKFVEYLYWFVYQSTTHFYKMTPIDDYYSMPQFRYLSLSDCVWIVPGTLNYEDFAT